MTADEILTRLRAQANPENAAGMARFGIRPDQALGITVNTLRQLAREIKRAAGNDLAGLHRLAQELWDSRIHEARILASIIDAPQLLSAAQMEAWAAEFNSWDLVDQCCSNLFARSPLGYAKAMEWSAREEEFVRRAAFSLMAYLAHKDKKLSDADYEPFFSAILAHCSDERNYVKKAVNWALREIGKRNPALRTRAVQVAGQMLVLDSRAARWNARDAMRELNRVAQGGSAPGAR